MNESVEEWKGPEKPVDLILASHVFYHVTNKLAAAKKLCTWIKPGGSLIIVLITISHMVCFVIKFVLLLNLIVSNKSYFSV